MPLHFIYNQVIIGRCTTGSVCDIQVHTKYSLHDVLMSVKVLLRFRILKKRGTF